MDWNALGMAAVQSLLPVVVAFLTALVPIALLVIRHYAKKWMDVDLTAKQQAIMGEVLYDAIGYAEEQASKALKEGVEPPSRRSKLEYAMDYATARAMEMGLPALATDALKEMIEARLGNGRSLPEKRTYLVGGES